MLDLNGCLGVLIVFQNLFIVPERDRKVRNLSAIDFFYSRFTLFPPDPWCTRHNASLQRHPHNRILQTFSRPEIFPLSVRTTWEFLQRQRRSPSSSTKLMADRELNKRFTYPLEVHKFIVWPLDPWLFKLGSDVNNDDHKQQKSQHPNSLVNAYLVDGLTIKWLIVNQP